MVWNHADRIKLLSLIEKRPWHWNKLDYYYTDNDFKENDFAEISKLMEKSTEECQRNWRSMKVCYYRMLRNGKSGKSERTKELANRSAFLKESFQLITVRPKRRAKSRVNQCKEESNDTINITVVKPDDNKLNELSARIEPSTMQISQGNKDNEVTKFGSNIDSPIKKNTSKNKVYKINRRRQTTLNSYCESNLKKTRHRNGPDKTLLNNKKNSDENFLVFGQLISKRLRTMNIEIARDTMHHIHNIIYEQQKYSKTIHLLDNS